MIDQSIRIRFVQRVTDQPFVVYLNTTQPCKNAVIVVTIAAPQNKLLSRNKVKVPAAFACQQGTNISKWDKPSAPAHPMITREKTFDGIDPCTRSIAVPAPSHFEAERQHRKQQKRVNIKRKPGPTAGMHVAKSHCLDDQRPRPRRPPPRVIVMARFQGGRAVMSLVCCGHSQSGYPPQSRWRHRRTRS